jgi:hypothetical protein
MRNAAVVRLREWLLVEAQPGAGSFVMATGIVAVGMELSGHGVIADILLAVCAAGWLVLATAFLYRLVARTDEWWLETSQLGALTAVAGSTVLAAALSTVLDWRLVPLLLWIVALILWVIVVSRALVRLPPRAPQGLVFLLTVATQGVSLVASTLAVAYDADSLVYLAFALWVVGIALYLLVELHDFDHGRITTGGGDQWVFGGAVAITVLAGGKLITAVRAQNALDGLAHDLHVAVLVTWVVRCPFCSSSSGASSPFRGSGTARCAGRPRSRSGCTQRAPSSPATCSASGGWTRISPTGGSGSASACG